MPLLAVPGVAQAAKPRLSAAIRVFILIGNSSVFRIGWNVDDFDSSAAAMERTIESSFPGYQRRKQNRGSCARQGEGRPVPA
jgi:hypothetical protein